MKNFVEWRFSNTEHTDWLYIHFEVIIDMKNHKMSIAAGNQPMGIGDQWKSRSNCAYTV